MRKAGRTISTIFLRTKFAGICLAAPSAARSSKTSYFSLPTTRVSVSTFQPLPVRSMSLRLLSVVEISARFVRQDSMRAALVWIGPPALLAPAAQYVQWVVIPTDVCRHTSFTTRAYLLAHCALHLPVQRRLAQYSRPTEFRKR